MMLNSVLHQFRQSTDPFRFRSLFWEIIFAHQIQVGFHWAFWIWSTILDPWRPLIHSNISCNNGVFRSHGTVHHPGNIFPHLTSFSRNKVFSGKLHDKSVYYLLRTESQGSNSFEFEINNVPHRSYSQSMWIGLSLSCLPLNPSVRERFQAVLVCVSVCIWHRLWKQQRDKPDDLFTVTFSQRGSISLSQQSQHFRDRHPSIRL